MAYWIYPISQVEGIKTRSLAAAVKGILDRGGGRIMFPNDQNIRIWFEGNDINVEHVSHPWHAPDAFEESFDREAYDATAMPGLTKISRVITRFRPRAEVNIFTESDLDELSREEEYR